MAILNANAFLDGIRAALDGAGEHRMRTGRPFCTLTYAQSVDGCIACDPMNPLAISGPESMVLTHRLRSLHDAILVGIRTVLADNPRLNVRLVDGPDPQPVVLDGNLRIPPDCRLLDNGSKRPWIAAGFDAEYRRRDELEAGGATVMRLPTDARGWIALDPLLRAMGEMGIDSLMIEGGARVLTSFMRARLVDQVVITIAPMMVGGVRAFLMLSDDPASLPRLAGARYTVLGNDLVLWGQPAWEDEVA